MSGNYKEFLKCVSESVKGIGGKTTEKIAEKIPSFKEFMEANPEDFKKLVNKNSFGTLIKIRELLDSKITMEENWMRLIFLKFLYENMKSVKEKTDITTLHINPFLAKAMKLNKPEDIISFYIYQSIGRGLVTSMGNIFQKISMIFGILKETKQAGFDAELDEGNGVTNFMQIKSGPDTLNVEMLRKLKDHIDYAKSQHPNCKTTLGLCYGTEEQVSSKILTYLPGGIENVIIGKKFWELVTGQKDFDEVIFENIDSALKSFKEYCEVLGCEEGQVENDIIEAINKQIDVILKNWHESYGNGVDSVNKVIKGQM